MLWCVSVIRKNKSHSNKFFYDRDEILYFPAVKERLPLLLLLLALYTSSFSQELNGIWKGTLTQQPGGCFPVYNIELQVKIRDNRVDGFCYHYSDINNYV